MKLMSKNTHQSRPEASAPENNIPSGSTMDGAIEMALLHGSHQTLLVVKQKEAAWQMARGEPVPVTLVLANDITGRQALLESYPEKEEFCTFLECLHTSVADVDPWRSTCGFHIKGAKQLLSATEEALIFTSSFCSGLFYTVAVPVLRTLKGDFLKFGEEFDIQWDPKLLHHAFGEEEADSSLPSQDQLEGKLWGNN
jgi:hypothetical protein